MKKLLIFIVSLSALVGCTAADAEVENLAQEDNVTFSSSILTKATDTQFELGDVIYVTSFAEGVAVSEDVSYTFGSNQIFNATTASITKEQDESLSYLALYPVANDGGTFTVKADQSSGTNYTLSDLMSSTAEATSSYQPTLIFDHLMTKIALDITSDVELTGATISAAGSVAYDPDSNSVTTISDQAMTITMRQTSIWGFDAIVAPQAIKNIIITILDINGIEYTVAYDNATETLSGYVYTATITVEDQTVTVEGIDYSSDVNDWNDGSLLGGNDSEATYYEVNIPEITAFEESKIIKIVSEGEKVGEICFEYLGVNNGARAVVVYPGIDYENGMLAYYVDADGAAEAASNCGGSVAIDYSFNAITVSDGTSAPLSTVYISSKGDITTTAPETSTLAATVTYTVEDREGNTYPVVKIGRDVWLGANLRATSLADGTEIPIVASSDSSSNTEWAAANYAGDDSDSFEEYGLLYNAATLSQSCAELVAAIDDDCPWKMSEGKYSSSTAAVQGYDYEWSRLFLFVGEYGLGTLLSTDFDTWHSGSNGEFDGVVTNLTGLSIPPAGENYSNGTIFFFGVKACHFQGTSGYGYNIADTDGRATDFAGVRSWTHTADWCSIRLVRADVRE